MDPDVRLAIKDKVEHFVGVVFELVARSDIREERGPKEFDALGFKRLISESISEQIS